MSLVKGVHLLQDSLVRHHLCRGTESILLSSRNGGDMLLNGSLQRLILAASIQRRCTC